MSPNNETHPGLFSILLENLLKARDIGFRILPMTNFLTVRSREMPRDMQAAFETTDAYWIYADRLRNCSEFIESMGCGSHDYKIMKQSQPLTDPKKFARAVAEWVDGDALSAHYAFNCDVFCTNDRGGSAGSGSIFHPNNLPKLKEHFGIVVLSPDELCLL